MGFPERTGCSAPEKVTAKNRGVLEIWKNCPGNSGIGVDELDRGEISLVTPGVARE